MAFPQTNGLQVGSFIRHEYEPWFLGFCRWDECRVVGVDGKLVITEPLRSGRWLWRGRDADYVGYVSARTESAKAEAMRRAA